MKILIMCEGPNELKIVNLLLDKGKFKFTRDDLLDMRPFHARQLTSPQLKPASLGICPAANLTHITARLRFIGSGTK